jgi:ATP synthase protein I
VSDNFKLSGPKPDRPGVPKISGRPSLFGEYRMLATASSIGLAVVLSILLGLFAGMWLDKRLKTEPLFLILGLLCGIAAGFRNIYVLAKRLEKAQKEGSDE